MIARYPHRLPNRRPAWRVAVLAFLTLVSSPAALLAATPSPGYPAPRVAQSPHAHFHISTREQLYIRDWYRRHPSRDRGNPLPANFRLRVGGPMPPTGTFMPLPPLLVRNLQSLPDGYGYIRVGFAVAIVDLRHRIVVDVVYGLLNR